MPSFAVKAIDTTGAGDAFVGAMLYKLHHHHRVKLATLSTMLADNGMIKRRRAAPQWLC